LETIVFFGGCLYKYKRLCLNNSAYNYYPTSTSLSATGKGEERVDREASEDVNKEYKVWKKWRR
jgi:hypothetical protein